MYLNKLISYGEKRITRLDIYFISSLIAILLILTINIFLKSINLVYITILSVLSVLLYATMKQRGRKNFLKDLWLLGLLSILPYPFIDYFFEAKLGLVTYLTNDPKIFVTPVYIFLYWIFGVLLFSYFYYRMRGLMNKVWIAGLLTGFFAATSAIFVENLFNAMEFYSNTPSYFMIWHIPIYIPLGYMLVFSFMPFYLRYNYISGLCLYGFTGLSWYLFYHIILKIALWL